MGRKKVKLGKRRLEIISCRLTRQEMRLIRLLAEEDSRTLASWLQAVIKGELARGRRKAVRDVLR